VKFTFRHPELVSGSIFVKGGAFVEMDAEQVQLDAGGLMRIYPLLRPLIFRLDAERAHRATIRA
jgi:hypothetical protein